MKLFLDSAPPAQDRQALRWTAEQLRRVAYLLNGRVRPEDQLDAEESEVTFAGAGAGGAQTITHDLDRTPDRVETVRADAAGVVYVTSRTATQVVLETTVAGTYRVRVS